MCKSTFLHTYNFFRHIEKFHSSNKVSPVDTDIQISQSVVSNTACNDTSSVANISPQHLSQVNGENCDSRNSPKDLLKSIQMEGIALVASLRANSSIPYAVIPQIVDSVNKICETDVEACHYDYVQNF